jgi:hypothetical protein
MKPTSNPGFSMEAPSTGKTPKQILTALSESQPEWQAETKKARFLDHLYDLYDRANAPSGLRGTYTGLWQQYARETAELNRFLHQ